MTLYIGNWENDTVTTISHCPTDRQLRNALRRMGNAKTFRYAPVGDRSVSDSDIADYNERVALTTIEKGA